MKSNSSHFILAILMSTCALASSRPVAMQDLLAHHDLNISAGDLFDKQDDAHLADAVGVGDLKRAQQLVAHGADVNAVGHRGMTPLLWALGKRNIDGFRFLLEHGADSNAVSCCDELAEGIVHRLSPMGAAARTETPVYLQQLLKHGGNPNLIINEAQETPLFSTLLYRRLENADLLIKAGADLNHKDIALKTPMAEAATETNYEMALLLLQAGADPTIKNKWGYSVIDHLKKSGNRALPILNNPRDIAAYDRFVEELKRRGALDTDPPRF